MLIKIYVIVVERTAGDWRRVGPVYRNRDTAKSWVSFVRSAWAGSPAKVKTLRLQVENGSPTAKSLALLDQHGIDPI